MKRIVQLSAIGLTLLLTACGSDNGESSEEASKDKPAKEEKTCTYAFSADKTTVNWTGYKHSTRAAVPGLFEKVQFEGEQTAGSIHELVMGLEGIVETASVYSNDTTRDRKLAQFFFNKMENGATISAKVLDMNPSYDADGNAKGSAKIEITMNGTTFTVPATYVIENLKVMVDADIKVEDFNGEDAYNSIADACSEKHTLESDGKPVTGRDFHINITTTVAEACE